MASLPPAAVAIWCIDEPGWYRMLLDHPDIRKAKGHPVWGLRVFDWSLEEIKQAVSELKARGRDEGWIARIYPFQEPGIWVQMNKGPHLKIDKGTGFKITV
jgi:hypothetical protein